MQSNLKIICTIEARMNSTRLPGKVLKPIMNRPMLELLVERVRQVKQIDEIVIATTEDISCDPIEKLARRIGVKCFRGSENDVLDRVLKAAQSVKGDIIVELTGDNPFVDHLSIAGTLDAFFYSQCDYCSTHLARNWPLGICVQVFPQKILEKVASLTNKPRDREHVSLFIYENPELFVLKAFGGGFSEDASAVRLTVDTEEDFKLATAIFELLYPKKVNFSLMDILNLRRDRPELFLINKEIRQKKA